MSESIKPPLILSDSCCEISYVGQYFDPRLWLHVLEYMCKKHNTSPTVKITNAFTTFCSHGEMQKMISNIKPEMLIEQCHALQKEKVYLLESAKKRIEHEH